MYSLNMFSQLIWSCINLTTYRTLMLFLLPFQFFALFLAAHVALAVPPRNWWPLASFTNLYRYTGHNKAISLVLNSHVTGCYGVMCIFSCYAFSLANDDVIWSCDALNQSEHLALEYLLIKELAFTPCTSVVDCHYCCYNYKSKWPTYGFQNLQTFPGNHGACYCDSCIYQPTDVRKSLATYWYQGLKLKEGEKITIAKVKKCTQIMMKKFEELDQPSRLQTLTG